MFFERIIMFLERTTGGEKRIEYFCRGNNRRNRNHRTDEQGQGSRRQIRGGNAQIAGNVSQGKRNGESRKRKSRGEIISPAHVMIFWQRTKLHGQSVLRSEC